MEPRVAQIPDVSFEDNDTADEVVDSLRDSFNKEVYLAVEQAGRDRLGNELRAQKQKTDKLLNTAKKDRSNFKTLLLGKMLQQAATVANAVRELPSTISLSTLMDKYGWFSLIIFDVDDIEFLFSDDTHAHFRLRDYDFTYPLALSILSDEDFDKEVKQAVSEIVELYRIKNS